MESKRQEVRGAVGSWKQLGVVLGGLVLALGLLAGCSQTGGLTDPTGSGMNAEVSVLSDPVGGTNVSSLSCTFEVVETSTSGSGPIVVRADWAAPCGVHKSETFTFTGGTRTFITTYDEPGGYPITLNFWVQLTWKDDRGSHLVRSATANSTAESDSGGGCTM